MRCRDARRLISERLDGPIGTKEERSLEKHLAACDQCRLHRREMQRLDYAFAAPPFVSAPPGFSDRVMSRLREQQAGLGTATVNGAPSLSIGGLGRWLGVALLVGWLWVIIVLTIGLVVFSLLGGWGLVEDILTELQLNGLLVTVGETIAVVMVAVWRIGNAMVDGIGAPVMVSSSVLAAALCVVWYHLLRRYRWRVG